MEMGLNGSNFMEDRKWNFQKQRMWWNVKRTLKKNIFVYIRWVPFLI